MSNVYRIPLRVVFYEESGVVLAHCLEFDLVGDGKTREESLQSLNDAIAVQVEWSVENDDPSLLFSPAPAIYEEMFAAGEDVVDGELQLQVAIQSPSPRFAFSGTMLREASRAADSRFAMA